MSVTVKTAEKRWRRRARKLDHDIADSIAEQEARFVEAAAEATPVRSGKLRAAWRLEQRGKLVRIVNRTRYAGFAVRPESITPALAEQLQHIEAGLVRRIREG